MNRTIIKMKFNFLLTLSLFLTGCFIAPGMHMKSIGKTIYIDSLDKNLDITPINELSNESEVNFSYKIGIGDQISVTIWGLPELFPIINITPDQNLRRVDQNGNIFFPYAGLVQALGKTQDELRNDITIALTKYFNDQQVDVTISRFNSQQIFVLGEVTRPSRINITDVPVSLSDAIGQSLGLNTNTAGKDVFIIRQEDINGNPKIYYANLKSPSYFIDAGKFFLMNNDIVYVNSSATTRWNKVVSQFFPFSAFLNSVDTFINKP
jgi:protein involved in polysaccharide export with SLBB domain